MRYAILILSLLVNTTSVIAADTWQNDPPPFFASNRANQVSYENFAYVSGAMRDHAVSILAESPFVRITPENAAEFTGRPSSVWVAPYLYLVRALRAGSGNFSLDFHDGSLLVADDPMSGGKPKPYALVVALRSELSTLYVSCCQGVR